ncbi:hypothetical protein [Microbacterium soli]|uniref:Uncharacterized protein n=1 Tax=Microbacterium soli TaxID=446075 RepID=A0ABP7NK93_9MICO
MAGSKRFEIDIGVNASGAAKGANDAAMAFADLEDAVGGVADESRKSGNTVDSFASKLVAAARKAGKSDDEIKAALRGYGVNAKDAERAIGRVGDEFKDTGRDGSRSLNDLEGDLRDVQQQSEKLGRSVDDIDVHGRKAFGGMGDAAKEVTQEVGQNLGEAVSSIRGDLSDLGQVGQDTLGGLAATIASSGPAGIAGAAALAAGAVGLGAITAELDKQNERVQALRQYFADAWKAAVEGGRDYIDLATVIGEMNDIQFNPERADEYKRIQEDAKRLDLDRQTLLRAAAGDQDALNMVIDRTGQLYDDQAEKVKVTSEAELKARGAKQADNARELSELRQINDRWREYGDINAENREKAADASRAVSEYLLSTIDSASSATRAVDDFGNVLVTLPDGQEIVIDAETGQASSDVSKFKEDTDKVVEQLDGSQINLIVKTALRDAQNQINQFITNNDGKSFTLHGHWDVSPLGGDV